MASFDRLCEAWRSPANYGGIVVAPGDGLVALPGFVFGQQPAIWKFSPDTPGGETPLSVGGLFGNPHDVAIGTDDIYVVDATEGIFRLEPGGGQTPIPTAIPLDQPIGIAIEPDTQDLLVLEFGNARVVRVNPATGAVSEVFRGFSLFSSGAAGIDVSDDSMQIAVSDDPANTIYVFRRSGFFAQDGDFSRLTENPDGTFVRTFPNGTEVHFDAAGFQQQVIDANRNTTTWSYAGTLPVLITDPVGRETQLTYAAGQLASIIDAADRITTFEHDGSDLVRITAPDGSEQQFTYDIRHRMTSRTNERRFADTYTYDAFGRYAQTRHADGSIRLLTPASTSGLFDPASGVGTESNPAPIVRPSELEATATDGEGRTSRFAIGPLGAAEMVTDAANLETTAERNDDANVTSIEMPSGHSMGFGYDAAGNRIFQADQTVGGTVSWVYEQPLNLLRSLTDADDEQTSFEYDTQGNRTASTSPSGLTSSFEYDASGLPISVIDRFGTTTTTTYDVLGNIIETRWGAPPEQRVETIGRTPEGYIRNVTDALGRVEGSSFDAAGQPLSRTLPDGRMIELSYDQRGNVESLTPPGRPSHAFSYTETGQLSAYSPPLIGLSNHQTTYQYNAADELVRVEQPDGTSIALTYGSSGLSSISIPRDTIVFTYGAAGQLSSITNGDSSMSLGYRGDLLTSVAWSGTTIGEIRTVHDSSYRLASIEVVGAGAPVLYTYDADGVLASAGDLAIARSPQTGLAIETMLGGVSESWGYNQFGEPVSYAATFGATELYSSDYTVDALGRIAGASETIEGATRELEYRFDLAGRLEEVAEGGIPIEVFVYDENDNRIDHFGPGGFTSATVDAQDRLLTHGANNYTYTAAGQLLTRSTGSETTTFDYDVLGNLRSVTQPDGTVIEYLIDGANRRIGKRINGTLVQGFLYKDSLNPIAELDGTGQIVSVFVYGTRQNVPDYVIRGGVTYRILSDRRGSPRLITDTAAGTIVSRIDYDTFGRVTLDTNPGFTPFGFGGGIHDQNTGLVRFGARDYDPTTGRFTSKDVALFERGNTNAYTYANDPVNSLDVDGKLTDTLTATCSRRPALCLALATAGFVGSRGLSQPEQVRAARASASTCLVGLNNAATSVVNAGTGAVSGAADFIANSLGIAGPLLVGGETILLAESTVAEWADFLRPFRDIAKTSYPRVPPPFFDFCFRRFVQCVFIGVGGQRPMSGPIKAFSERRNLCLSEYQRCLEGKVNQSPFPPGAGGPQLL